MKHEQSAAMTGRAKRIGVISVNVLLWLFMVFAAVALAFSLVGRLRDGAVTLFGVQMRVVLTESMAKNDAVDTSDYEIKDIPAGSMVFVEVVPDGIEARSEWFEGLRVNDVLTFRYVFDTQKTVTHRLVGKESDGEGGYVLTLKGDNAGKDAEGQVIRTAEHEVSPNYVIGRVVGQSRALGAIVSAVSHPIGLLLAVIIPSLLIAAFEIFRIVGYFTEDRRKRREDELLKKENEIAELRQRLEEMQKGASENSAEANNGSRSAETAPVPPEGKEPL